MINTNKYIYITWLLIYSFCQSIFLLSLNNSMLSKIFQAFLLFILYLLSLQIHKYLFRIFIIFSFLLTLFVYPTLYVYGEPNYNHISSLIYTNMQEAISYIKIIPYKVFLIIFIFSIGTFSFLFIDIKPIKQKYYTLFLVTLLTIFPIKKIIENGIRTEHIHKYFSTQVFKRTSYFMQEVYRVRQEAKYIQQESRKPSSWKIINSNQISLKDNFVIVIGESVRRDFLNSYGFKISNTPFINSSKKLIFDNYISIAPKTIPSLIRTLALSHNIINYQLNNNIINLAHKVGYETFWISNQGILGDKNAPVSVIANYSNHTSFIRKGTGLENKQDYEMLPIIQKTINQKSSKPKLIIIHMMGSHVFACDRTEGKYDEFILSKEISCYNKSIRNTDSFLSEIYNYLKQTNKSFNLIYFSDHGQITDGKSVLHNHKVYKESYDVPLIIWGEDILKTKRFHKERISTDFLYLFSELNNIKTKNLDKNYKFVSDEDIKNNNVINSNEEIISYESLPSNSINQYLK